MKIKELGFQRSLVDLNSFVAVESFFRAGSPDPWAEQILAEFADAFIYADRIHYPLPVPQSSMTDPPDHLTPAIVHKLASRESGLLVPKIYATDEPPTVSEEHFQAALLAFVRWLRPWPNRRRLRNWCKFHKESWIVDLALAELARKYVFDIEHLRKMRPVREISRSVGITEDAFLYAFDSVLRFPMYGEMTDKGEFYLNHPLRDSWGGRGIVEFTGDPPPEPPLPFSNIARDYARGRSLDDYCVLLHKLRELVREFHIDQCRESDIDEELRCEILGRAGVPGVLRGSAYILGSMTIGSAAVGLINPLAGFALGAVVAVLQPLWQTGISVPSPFVKNDFLRRRMIRYPLQSRNQRG